MIKMLRIQGSLVLSPNRTFKPLPLSPRIKLEREREREREREGEKHWHGIGYAMILDHGTGII